MKRLIFCVLVCVLSLPAFAQTDENPFEMTVVAQSANVREVPSLAGEFVASTFRDDPLEATGRNMDGRWFLVRRPGRMSTLGWISVTVVDYDFRPETLPLVDFSTNVTGDFVMNRDPGYAGYTLAEVNLRVQPMDGSEVITRAPFGTVLPILERDQVGTWFLVNYRGTLGWVNAVNLRGLDAFESIPIAAGLPDIPVSSALIIPLDVQLSEIQEFRDYLNAQNVFAINIVAFWSNVYNYEAMPCEPPEFVTNYLFNESDERAFPELYYLVPRLDAAIEFINEAIDPMYTCGVKRPQLVLDARNAALNASIIYDATLDSIDRIEAQITRNR